MHTNSVLGRGVGYFKRIHVQVDQAACPKPPIENDVKVAF